MFALQMLLFLTSRMWGMLECDYSFHYFGEINEILIFVKSYKRICVSMLEWLSGMNRNHVVFAHVVRILPLMISILK